MFKLIMLVQPAPFIAMYVLMLTRAKAVKSTSIGFQTQKGSAYAMKATMSKIIPVQSVF
jgi:hypothetical protein